MYDQVKEAEWAVSPKYAHYSNLFFAVAPFSFPFLQLHFKTLELKKSFDWHDLLGNFLWKFVHNNPNIELLKNNFFIFEVLKSAWQFLVKIYS